MLNFLSISYLLLILITIIYRLLAIDSSLRLAFINGENLIRCSNNEIHFLSISSCLSQDDYETILTCENKYNYIDEFFMRLQWNKFSLVCNEKNESIWEKIEIIKEDNQLSSINLFELQHEVDFSHEIYPLSVHNTQQSFIFESKNISIKNLITNSSKKTIYLRFLHQPILCRVQFSIHTVLCSTKENFVDKSEFACYYDPISKFEPSIEIMEAEFKQLETIKSFDRSKTISKLQIQRPHVINEYFLRHTNIYSTEQQQAKLKSKSIFLAIIILLICLVALITIVLLQFIKKPKPIQKQSSPIKLEKGISQISASTIDDSIQSIGNDADDDDEQPTIDFQNRPNIFTQKTNRNKLQRPGITMNFEEDE